MWLKKCNKHLNDLEIEKQVVPQARRMSWTTYELRDHLTFNLIHEYRTWGLYKLEEAYKEYDREVVDLTREFGELHFIPLGLYGTMADLMDALGEFAKSKTLRMRIRDQIKNTDGVGHPYYIRSILNVAQSHLRLGEFIEAQQLFQGVLKLTESTQGSAVTSIKGNLAVIFSKQARWKEAEELFLQIVDMQMTVLGREHPDTLNSMANLATTYNSQGRWMEAEELELQVMESHKMILGQEHPHTLTAMGSLASIYSKQGRWKETEKLEVQIMETFKKVLGQENPDTLTCMENLAATYRDQGRWKEAEELEVQVMDTFQRVLGQEHPDTVNSMINLASPYSNQGRMKEAEELDVQAIEMFKTQESTRPRPSRYLDQHGQPRMYIRQAGAMEGG